AGISNGSNAGLGASRVIYNQVLVAVVAAYFAARHPARKQGLTTDSILVLFLLAVVATSRITRPTLSTFLRRSLAFAHLGGLHAEFCWPAVLLLQPSWRALPLSECSISNPADKKCYSHPLMRAM